jgi:hypothetical protein
MAISHSSTTSHWKYRAITVNAIPAPSAIRAKPRAAVFHTPHERPIKADSRKIASQTRPICSRGYKPTMNSVRLASITPQRASVIAHSSAGLRSAYSNQSASSVSTMLYQVLNRFLRSHAIGPTTVTGGFISAVSMAATLTLHQLNAPVVDVHQ